MKVFLWAILACTPLILVMIQLGGDEQDWQVRQTELHLNAIENRDNFEICFGGECAWNPSPEAERLLGLRNLAWHSATSKAAASSSSHRDRLLNCYGDLGEQKATLLADTYLQLAPGYGFDDAYIENDLQRNGC